MKLRKLYVGGGSTAILLVLVLGLVLVFGGGANTGDVLSEPLDDGTKAQFQGTHLGFIAETGRIVVNEYGGREIIWDPPPLPTLEESINKGAQAAEAGDMDLLPLCTIEYLEFLKAQKDASGETVTPGDATRFPACNGIPESIGFGKGGAPLMSSTDAQHVGYYYAGTSVSQGINGAISRDDPSLNTDDEEWVAARFLISRTYDGVRYWLEAGWAEYSLPFGDEDQHTYTQQCDSVRGANDNCIWNNYNHLCDDTNNTLAYIASQSNNTWDSFCWNFGNDEWVRMWAGFDAGDDDAHALEAFFEAKEVQDGTIAMDTVRFYGLELRDETEGQVWDTRYQTTSYISYEGGYFIVINSLLDDFNVNN